MKSSKNNSERRKFLKASGVAMAFVPATALFGSRAFADGHSLLVDPESPTAVGFNYVAVSTTEGKNCENCALYMNPTDGVGDCPLFPGKKVAAEAWCNAYAPKG